MTVPRRGRGWQLVDAAATFVLFGVMVVAVLASVAFVGLFSMATDSCGTDCRTSRVDLGVGVTFVGIVLAWVVAAGGAVLATDRGWVRSLWPLLGTGLIVLSVIVGGSVADTASG